MGNGRQPVLKAGCSRRLEGGQVEDVQNRGSAERIVDLGPREDRGSQCGSRGEVIKIEKRVALLEVVENGRVVAILESIPCMCPGYNFGDGPQRKREQQSFQKNVGLIK